MAALSTTLDELAPSFEALCLIFDQLYTTEPPMADRFPSLEELSEGELANDKHQLDMLKTPNYVLCPHRLNRNQGERHLRH